mmetsp:Transcript_1210/g.4165  ORF Transcript_1210/g.4165 Transcript_1210/m.4165 type:complete len:150 (+) Transcript_1210:29-478(+)
MSSSTTTPPSTTTPAPSSTTTTRRTSKRPSSQILSQIKSQQSKLKKQVMDEERDADLIAQQEDIEMDAPQKHQYDSNAKEFFFKINDQVEWAIMRVASYEKMLNEIKLVSGASDDASIRIHAVRANLNIATDEDYKKLRDHGEMLKVEL